MRCKTYFQNSDGLTLVGNLWETGGMSGIVLFHGFTGDKSEWGRFEALAESLYRVGFTVLSLDFRGSGESDDAPLTVEGQVQDFHDALAFMKKKDIKKIGVLGLSLGGLVALRGYSSCINTLVLWAPVTERVACPQARYTRDQLAELSATGVITYRRNKGVRPLLTISQQMLEERAGVDQRALLSSVTDPVLIVHGGSDDRVPIAHSEKALEYLPDGSKLLKIWSADHGFYEHLSDFINPTVEWFQKHL